VSEKLIFVMPEYLEEALFAIPVMGHYLAGRNVIGRDCKDVTVVCNNQELTKLIRSYWIWAKVTAEVTQDELQQADFIYEFDSEMAYKISSSVEKHISDAFGIQLGAGLTRFLPSILTEDTPEVSGSVLVVERNGMDRPLGDSHWKHRERFIEIGQENEIKMAFLGAGAYFEETRCAVGRASVVVGVRGAATLVAAAAGKIVMELVPRGEFHKQWMTKWENSFYRMAYGTLDDMIPEYVWNRTWTLVQEATGKAVKKEEVMA
jgi:hypothetical protein